MRYILSIDQSTQGTKAMLFDEQGKLTARVDRLHRQIVNEQGWVEHDPVEILENVLLLCPELLEKAGVSGEQIAAMGSPTSGKRCSAGMLSPESPCTTPSSGSAPGRRSCAAV